MALYYETGNGWKLTTLAKNDLGLDAYLCCPGPSLNNINPDKLKGKGRMIFAINTAYPYIKPDVWIGLDKIECYDRNILFEPFIKIFRGTYYNEMIYNNKQVKYYPQIYWASLKEPEPGKTMLNYRNHNDFFVWHKNTLATALHIMIWMGARNIYLLGCDMGGNSDYYDNRILTSSQRNYNQRLYKKQIVFIKKLASAAKQYGISIQSATPNSPLNKYLEYTPNEDAIKQSEAKIEIYDNAIMHVLDLEKIYEKAYKNKAYRITTERYDHAIKYLSIWRSGKLLDVACGRGEILDFADKAGFDVKGTEIVDSLIDGDRIVKAFTHELPFNDGEFDYLTCLDVLEHIEPDNTMATLKEFDRVASKAILLSIANFPSKGLDGVELHINIKSYKEWDRLIREILPHTQVLWLNKEDNISESWLIIKSI